MVDREIREIKVRVTANASRNYIEEAPFDTLRIGVTSPSEAHRANEHVRELLADHFNVPVKQVVIIKGTHSPSKIVRIYL